MGRYRLTQFLLITLVVGIGVSVGEIHRTKAAIHRTKSRRAEKSGDRDVAVGWDPTISNTQGDMVLEHLSFDTLCCALLSAISVGLSGIFPLLVIPIEAGPSLKHGDAAVRLKLLLSFAVGALLGDVFLHLLPEAWAHVPEGSPDGQTKIGLWVIAGIMMFLIIEKTFGEDEEEEEKPQSEAEPEEKEEKIENSYKNHILSNTENLKRRKSKEKLVSGKISTISKTVPVIEKEHITVSGYLNLMANVIDNFTHGLAVGGSYLVSRKVGMVTTLAILLHEIPHEIGDFAILLKAGFNRWRAAKAQLLTASGSVVGAVFAMCADSPESAGDRTAWILPFTSGGFLYIALVTVVPDLLQERKGRESIKQVCCLILGVLSMVMVTFLFEE